MPPREKDFQLKQLEALAIAKIEQAEQQKILAGRISPEVVAEVYRIEHQILTLLEDRMLDTKLPDYLFGPYTALLELHKSCRAQEEALYGRANMQTVCKIARLEHMLGQLRKQDSPKESETKQPALIAIREGLRRLLL